jgi:hypothetical protein
MDNPEKLATYGTQDTSLGQQTLENTEQPIRNGQSLLSSTCVLCTLCYQFLRIVHFWLLVWYSLMFVVLDLCPVYPMLPVSQDCIRNGQSRETGNIGYTGHKSRTTNIREYRTSNQKWTIPRSLTCVLCTLCCQFLWIVHFWLLVRYSLMFVVRDLCPVYPMLPVFLDFKDNKQ